MDEKNKTITSYSGGDSSYSRDSGGISLDIDLPENTAADTQSRKSTAGSTNAEEYLSDFRSYVNRYNQENETTVDYTAPDAYISAAGQTSYSQAAEDAYLSGFDQDTEKTYVPEFNQTAKSNYVPGYDNAAESSYTTQYGQVSQTSESVFPSGHTTLATDNNYTPRYGQAAQSSGSSSGTAQYGQVPQASGDTYRRSAKPAETYSRPTRNPKYVTKGALAICMVITMLVSSVLGALVGGIIGGESSGSGSAGGDSDLSHLSLGDSTGSDLTISEIVAMNADAVVEILVSATAQNYFGQMQVTEGAGSGVIVQDDGYIVTNYHVIQGANKVQVTLHNGETYPAAIVGGDNDNDIAIIKINATDLKVATIGDSSTVAVGDTAVAIGNPLGQLGGTATTGIISALDRNLEIEGRSLTLMQTDAAINGGNSGGGLFNSKGELIGIVDAKSSGVGIEGLAFAIPINSVTSIINDIIENGSVKTRPVVGVTIADVSEENAQFYKLESAGVYITQVTGENAKKAGFQAEDRIVSIEGEKIETSQQFIAAVRKHKAGDTVSIVVSRKGQEIEIKTVLEEYTSTDW